MLYYKVPPFPHALKLFDFPFEDRGKAEKSSLWVESVSPFSSGMWFPSHCWPLLTPPLRDPPLPQRCANLCCALNRCPNTSLSGGGGGKPGLWQEKNAAIFMALPDYHTAEDLYLGGGRGFRHTFPTIQISWVVKRSDEKGWRGVEGGVSAGVNSPRLYRAEAVEPCLKGPLPTQEVLC